jgi:hypothetical protein
LISPDPQSADARKPGTALVAWFLASCAVLAAFYAVGVALSWMPFNSGAWLVGEEASRGWLSYLVCSAAHLAAAVGLWRQRRWARWLSIFLLAAGLLPAVPAISAAVVDSRISGIAFWGVLIVVRAAALYLLLQAE